MGTSDWIALGVGSYAALVATTALIWNIIRAKPKVNLKVRHGVKDRKKTNNGTLTYRETLEVTVVNNGKRPIEINQLGFKPYRGGSWLFPGFERLGFPLQGGTSHTFVLDIEGLKRSWLKNIGTSLRQFSTKTSKKPSNLFGFKMLMIKSTKREYLTL
jgi:hypothetical protein